MVLRRLDRLEPGRLRGVGQRELIPDDAVVVEAWFQPLKEKPESDVHGYLR